MGESVREVCGSLRIGGKNPKSVWWNVEIKAAVWRKEAAGKGVLAASNEDTKERYMEASSRMERPQVSMKSQEK